MTVCTAQWRHPALMRQAILRGPLLEGTVTLLSPSVDDAQVTTNIPPSGLNTQINLVGNSHNIAGGTGWW